VTSRPRDWVPRPIRAIDVSDRGLSPLIPAAVMGLTGVTPGRGPFNLCIASWTQADDCRAHPEAGELPASGLISTRTPNAKRGDGLKTRQTINDNLKRQPTAPK
jgi:hypothetical protein